MTAGIVLFASTEDGVERHFPAIAVMAVDRTESQTSIGRTLTRKWHR
jgi:hypothetical protein